MKSTEKIIDITTRTTQRATEISKRATGRLVEIVKSPEAKVFSRQLVRTLGNVAFEGALGENGLKVTHRKKNGDLGVHPLRAAETMYQLKNNPNVVAEKAGHGIAHAALSVDLAPHIEAGVAMLKSRPVVEQPVAPMPDPGYQEKPQPRVAA